MSKKINPLYRKVPLRLSITNQVAYQFEKTCEKFGIDKNDVAESLFRDFLGKKE